eukprot:Rmarinus@m.18242
MNTLRNFKATFNRLRTARVHLDRTFFERAREAGKQMLTGLRQLSPKGAEAAPPVAVPTAEEIAFAEWVADRHRVLRLIEEEMMSTPVGKEERENELRRVYRYVSEMLRVQQELHREAELRRYTRAHTHNRYYYTAYQNRPTPRSYLEHPPSHMALWTAAAAASL